MRILNKIYIESMEPAVKAWGEVGDEETIIGAVQISKGARQTAEGLPDEFTLMWQDVDYVLRKVDKHIVPESLRVEITDVPAPFGTAIQFQYLGRLEKN